MEARKLLNLFLHGLCYQLSDSFRLPRKEGIRAEELGPGSGKEKGARIWCLESRS